jgi:uncharacterized protein YbjT (DUF2867 family)
MNVLVTGATGFIGNRLCSALSDAGHTVAAMTRHPDDYRGAGSPVYGDIDDPASLADAVADCEVAYYLVHSLARPDFEERDRVGARSFGRAAADVGLRQVIYLGGLGDEADDLSPHLKSRREVERVLREAAPTTALRAGVVIGDGGISWEILRQLVERLPAMVTPRWVDTRTQPIAIDDALAILLGVLGREEAIGDVFDVGGPDTLTYRQMLATVARLTGRRRLIVPVPLLSPRLSSHWLRLITDVDLATARALVDSLTNEVVVRDHRIDTVVGRQPMGFPDAARLALRARAARLRSASAGHAAA